MSRRRHDQETAGSAPALLWSAFRHYASDRPALALGLAAAVLAGSALSSLPWLAGRGLDAAIDPDRDDALTLGLLFGGIAVAEALLRGLARIRLIRRSRVFEAETKAELHSHLRRVRLDELKQLEPADLVSRLGDDVEQLRFATGPALLHGTQALVVLPGVTIGLLSREPSVALLAGVAAIALGLCLALVTPSLRRHARALQRDLGQLGQRAEHAIAHQRTWRALGTRDRESDRIVDSAKELSETKLKLAFTRAKLDLSIHTTLETVAVLGLLATGLAILDGDAEPGDLLQLYVTLGIALTPLLTIGALAGALPRAVAAAERLEELRRLPVEPESSNTALRHAEPGTALGAEPGIEIRDLAVDPPRRRSSAKQSFDLDLSAGRRIGLVGPIGAGKSTLLETLAGIREAGAGTLEVDGEVHHLEGNLSRREFFALVDQEPTLWDGTLRENLALVLAGVDSPTDEEWGASLRAAGLDPDGPELPDGLDTRIGEGGITLSGGQRQRVAIARALVSRRPVLLLDDAFSALDLATERKVIEALEHERRTLVLASHRLRSMPALDEILVLDQGGVLDRGTHEELIARCEVYSRSFRLQQEAALLEGDPEGPR